MNKKGSAVKENWPFKATGKSSTHIGHHNNDIMEC